MSWIFIADDGEQVHYEVPPQVVVLEQRINELEAEMKGLREAARDVVNCLSIRGRERHYGPYLLQQADQLAALLEKNDE